MKRLALTQGLAYHPAVEVRSVWWGGIAVFLLCSSFLVLVVFRLSAVAGKLGGRLAWPGMAAAGSCGWGGLFSEAQRDVCQPYRSRFQGMAFSLMSLWLLKWPTLVLFLDSEVCTPWWRKPGHLTRMSQEQTLASSEICTEKSNAMPSWREVSKSTSWYCRTTSSKLRNSPSWQVGNRAGAAGGLWGCTVSSSLNSDTRRKCTRGERSDLGGIPRHCQLLQGWG